MEDKVWEVARRMSAERGGERREGACMNPTLNGRSTTQCLTRGDVSKIHVHLCGSHR